MVKYEGKMTCPFCKHSGEDFQILREWAYNLLLVNFVKCPSCDKNFRMNWGERIDGSYIEYYIPKLKP